MVDATTTQKLKYFLDNKIEIHVSLVGGDFYNGFIIRILEHYFELNDRKLGIVPVFWAELSKFEPCVEEER